MRRRHILHIHYHLGHYPGEGYDPDLYERLIEQLHTFSPRVRALPPMAADCDVTGALRYFRREPRELARVISMRALALYGVDTSIGSADNRLLAAMAADATPPAGITHLAPDAVPAFLRPRPVGALPGVGPSAAGLLVRHGLHTIGALADTPLGTLQRLLGRAQGRLLHERAHGLDERPVTPREPARSCGADHAFGHDELDPSHHRRAVLALAEQLGVRLRSERRITRRLQLTIRYADRTTTTRARALPEPSHHGGALIRTAHELYDSLGLQRARVRGIALRAEELQPAEHATTQLSLDPADERDRRIEHSADRARDRFGPGAVRSAALAGMRLPAERPSSSA